MPASLVATRQQVADVFSSLASFAYLRETPGMAPIAGRQELVRIFLDSLSSIPAMSRDDLSSLWNASRRRRMAVPLLGLFLGALLTAGARASTVEARSPFLPEAGGAEPTAPVEAIPLELRGIVSTPAGYLFGIYDSVSHQSTWLKVGEAGGGLTVRSHDREQESVVADFRGRQVTLSLRSSLPRPAVAAAIPSTRGLSVSDLGRSGRLRRMPPAPRPVQLAPRS